MLALLPSPDGGGGWTETGSSPPIIHLKFRRRSVSETGKDNKCGGVDRLTAFHDQLSIDGQAVAQATGHRDRFVISASTVPPPDHHPQSPLHAKDR